MNEKLVYKVIKDLTIVIILFIIQKVVRCYIYDYDNISVLFGIFLLAISFILHGIIDDIIIKYRLKKALRELKKELEELKKKYEV